MHKWAIIVKTSIRFFEDVPVRAVWDDDSSKWLFCAADIAEALTKSKNPRSYWNAPKRRKNELSTICRQLKLKARDRNEYLSAMQISPVDGTAVLALIRGALTHEIDDCEIFMKGVDFSYYYEEED